MKKELFQLQLLVTTTEKRRLEQVRPRQTDGETPPCPDLDALAVVFVPRSVLTAWLLVYPPVGDGMELEELEQTLEQEPVCFGVDKAPLDCLPQSPDRYFHLFLAAQGTPPVHGTDGQVEELFPRTVDRHFAVDEKNRVDYTSQTFFHHVEEGGDLIVARGVQSDNQAVIRAQRNVYAKYLENCCVYVKQTLRTDCIINCDVYCDGTVEVRSGRMTVIGGTVRAAQEVRAGIIGSRAESRTDIILGGLPCGDMDYNLLIQEAREIREEIERIERQPESPHKTSRLSKLRVQLIVAQKKMAQINKEKEPPEESGQTPGIRWMRCDTVWLTIDETTCQIDRMMYSCMGTLVSGEICLV